MSSTPTENCCLGDEFAGDDRVHSQEIVWEACEQGIRQAIQAQLDGEESPVVIDGLPTTGKTNAATKVLASFDPPGVIFTHLLVTRDDHFENITNQDCSVVKLPSLEKDCPSAGGEHGEGLADRIRRYNNRGASPKYIHRKLADDLPCMQGGDCEYLRKWDEADEADVLIGHPVHAGLPEAIDGRIVVFDEDPEDSYRTKFSSSKLNKAISTFLRKQDDLPINNRSQIDAAATSQEYQNLGDNVLEALEDCDQLSLQSEALDEDDGHARAPAAVLALLQSKGAILGLETGGGSQSWNKDLFERVELEYIELPNGAAAIRDYRDESLYIRDPPDLSTAEAVVGLDGTPTKAIWNGRLGVSSVSVRRVLCDSCRQEYLKDVIGYTIIQTTASVNPYSSGTSVNRRGCYGLIEAVAARHSSEVPVITTKKAAKRLFENEPTKPYIHQNRVTDNISAVKHYGNLRSSNEFEGEAVGIVLGSPHPGDRPIQVTAAFEGEIAERGDTRGLDLSYGPRCDKFLDHYREHKVAQAILRFGRTNPATIYVHTAALPSWLQEFAVTPEDESMDIDLRGEAMRRIMYSLNCDGGGTVQDIATREEVGFSENHVRDMLKRLQAEGIVERLGNQPYTWCGINIERQPHTAAVTLPVT